MGRRGGLRSTGFVLISFLSVVGWLGGSVGYWLCVAFFVIRDQVDWFCWILVVGFVVDFWLEDVSMELWCNRGQCENVSLKLIPVIVFDYGGSQVLRVHVPPLTLMEFDGFSVSISSSIVVEDKAIAAGWDTFDDLVFGATK